MAGGPKGIVTHPRHRCGLGSMPDDDCMLVAANGPVTNAGHDGASCPACQFSGCTRDAGDLSMLGLPHQHMGHAE